MRSGESYLALLTAGPTGITVTKSLRAPAPTRPAPPPWEPVLAVLEVLAVLPESTPEIAALTKRFASHLANLHRTPDDRTNDSTTAAATWPQGHPNRHLADQENNDG